MGELKFSDETTPPKANTPSTKPTLKFSDEDTTKQNINTNYQFGKGITSPEDADRFGFQTKTDIDNYELAAQKQSSLAKLGSGLTNAVSQTILDIGKDAGYLLDFENITNLTKSSEEGFSNWFSDSIQKLEDKLKLPVYRTKDSQGFSPLSAGWWGDNIPSIFTTASMFIMPELGVRGLSKLGETGINLAKSSKLLGGTKLVEGMSKLAETPYITNAMKGITGAVISRQMESLMEGGQTFKDTYNQAIKGGKNEDEAKKIAGEAAANNYKLNWAALIQDIPEYMLLHKTFSGATKGLGEWAKELAKTAVLEGSEEGYQYVTDKEAQRNALIKGDVLKDDKSSFSDRMAKYASDGDFWTSTVLGALGGAGFGVYGVHKNNKAQETYESILGQHKALLMSDPMAFNREQDNQIIKHIADKTADGQLDQFKVGLKFIQSNPERISDEDRPEIMRKVNSTLNAIDYADKILKPIINDSELTTELKKYKYSTLLQSKLIEQRLQEIQTKLTPLIASDLIHLSPDLRAYKIAKLSYEAIKSDPLLITRTKELETSLKEVSKELTKRYYPTLSLKDGINEVLKSTKSSNDQELSLLLKNKETETNNLNQAKTILHNLDSKEGKTKEQDNINKQKEEETKQATNQKIQNFAEELSKGVKLKDPEHIQFYENNKKEIEKQLKVLQKKQDKTELTSTVIYNGEKHKLDTKFKKEGFVKIINVKNPKNKVELSLEDYNKLVNKESTLGTDKDTGLDETSINQPYTQENSAGKISNTAFKTELGEDNQKIDYNERYFRYLENNTVNDKKLLIVTKNNNPKLYNEILAERKEAKKFEEDYKKKNKKDYPGIYATLVDKNLQPIKVDGKLLHSTLSTETNINEKNKSLKTPISKEEINALVKLREDILKSKDSNAYLLPNGKSKGIPVFLSKINGERQSNSVIGVITDDINNLTLELVTEGYFAAGSEKGEGEHKEYKKKLDAGKLYAFTKEGRIIDLVPRNINQTEAELVLNLIKQQLGLIEKTKSNSKKEAEKLIKFGISKTDNHSFDLQLNKTEQTITFGTKTIKVADLSDEELLAFLRTKRINAVTTYNLDSKFIDAFGNSFNSYKEYLLEGNQPKFGTDLQPKGQIQFKNIYITYDSNIKSDSISNNTKEHNTAKSNKIKNTNIDFGEEKLNRLADTRLLSRPKLSQEEINWFKKAFPNIPIEVIQGLIEQKAFGQFISAGKVLLSTEATIGTLRHEAFHTVTQLYLTKKELDNLYNEAKKITGIKDKLTLEEKLAEDFVDYNKTNAVLGKTPIKNNLFRRLLNFVKDLLNIKASSIEDIYRRIDKGFYKNKTIVGIREFNQLNRALPDKNEKFTKDLLDGIDSWYFDILYKNNITPEIGATKKNQVLKLIKARFDKLSKVNTDTKLFNYINSNWETITKHWEDRLSSIGIELIEDETEAEEVNEDENPETKGFETDNKFEHSIKSIMSINTRLLIRSIKTGKKNSLGLDELVDFNSTYNFLLKRIQGSSSNYESVYNKLVELSKEKPELKQLIDKLGKPTGVISLDNIIAQNQFVQDLSKNKYDSYIVAVDPEGKYYSFNANKFNEAGKIEDVWKNNLFTKIPQNKTGKQIVDDIVTKEPNDIKFLFKLGIEFSNKTIEEFKGNREFAQAVSFIRKYITDNTGDVTNLFNNDQIKGRINYLSSTESEFTPIINELSFVFDGKTQYSVHNNNALSIIKNDINNAKTKEELFKLLPHLDTITNQNSIFLNRLFDEKGNKKEGVTLNIDLFQGIQSINTQDGFTSKSRSLSIADMWLQHFTNILTLGKSSFIVSSDKTSEFGVSLTQPKQKLIVPIDEFKDGFNSEELKDIFRGYFKDEFKRITLFKLDGIGQDIDQYYKSADNWTIFSNIIPADIRSKINKQLDEWAKEGRLSEDLTKELNDLYQEALNQVSLDKYFSTYYDETVERLDKYAITELVFSKELSDMYHPAQLVRAAIANDFINSVEQTKLFLGDLAFYKDLYKRTSGAAGVKLMPRVDEHIDEFLNETNKRKDQKIADGKIKVESFEDVKTFKKDLNEYVNILVDKYNFNLEQAKELLSKYQDMTEGDAQGWITLDEYREFYIRLGKWNQKYENIFDKLQAGIKVDPKELMYFLTLKAQYFGPQEHANIFAPAFHKYSLMPLIPDMVKGTNLEKILEQMTNKQIGYALFKSASKVGTKVNDKGKTNRMYTNTTHGEVNTQWDNIQTIYYKFLGLQQESSPPKDKAIFGTQFRKLLFVNLFEGGKEVFKGASKLFEDYTKTIDTLIAKEESKLIKELGIDPTNYTVKDVKKLVETLHKEFNARKLPDNIIDSIQVETLSGKLMYKFDQIVNKAKIDSMIMSIVNARLIRQKINGDAYVQGAVSGFEKFGKREVGESKELEFYRVNPITEKTLPMQIKLSMSKNYYPLLAKFGGSLVKLNQAIREGKINDKRLISLVGYRIPTQGFNSMESMEIIEFLPEESGTSIIVPTALVAKSGGDFDIDKLFTFRPSFKPSKIQYKYIVRTINEDLERFNDIINNNTIESNIIKQIFSDTVRIIESDVEREFKITSEELVELKKTGGSLEKLTQYYDNSDLQNKIIEIAKEIIEHEHNFPALITTNSTNILSDVASEVKYQRYINDKILKGEKYITDKEKYLENQSKSIYYDKLLKLWHKIESRYKLWLAKDEVGIVAIANTFNVLSQVGNVTINVTEEHGKINFKHNQTEDGKVNLSKIKDSDNNNNISEITSQALNATVDAASEEEPTIYHLNMTLDTLPVYLYLNRAGVPFELAGYFMTQPIITNYLQAQSINSSALLKITDNSKDFKTIVDSAKKRYNDTITKKDNDSYITQVFTDKDQLHKWLNIENQQANPKEFALTQLQVLDDFLRYKEDAQLLQDFVKALNHDTNGVGKNLNQARLKIDLAKKVKADNFVNGLEDILDKTFIGSFDKNQFVLDTYSQFYNTQQGEIQENIYNLVNEVQKASFKKVSEKDKLTLFTLIENEFINYVVQNYGYSDISKYKNKIFKTDSVAKKLLDIKNNKDNPLNENLLLQQLYPMLNSELKGKKIAIDNIKIFTKRYDTFTANQLTESFRELKDSDPTLAKELMDVGILQSGLNNSPITYLGLIPEEYYNSLTKEAFNQFDKKNGVEDLYKFNQLFLRNNSQSIAWPLAYKLKLNKRFNKGTKELLYDNTLGYGIFGKDYDINKFDQDLSTVNFNTKETKKSTKEETNSSNTTDDFDNSSFNMNKVEDTEESTSEDDDFNMNKNEGSKEEVQPKTEPLDWNTVSDKILVKDNTMTKEIWNGLSDEEKQNIIDCL